MQTSYVTQNMSEFFNSSFCILRGPNSPSPVQRDLHRRLRSLPSHPQVADGKIEFLRARFIRPFIRPCLSLTCLPAMHQCQQPPRPPMPTARAK